MAASISTALQQIRSSNLVQEKAEMRKGPDAWAVTGQPSAGGIICGEIEQYLSLVFAEI